MRETLPENLKIDRVGDEIVVYADGELVLRERFPTPRRRVRGKDRGQWLSLWVFKRLGADISKITPCRLRKAL